MNHNRRDKRKNKEIESRQYLKSTDIFYSLEIFSNDSELYGTEQSITCSPTISIKSNDMILSYESCSDKKTFSYFDGIFSNDKIGSEFTLTDAVYSDVNLGVEEINLSGTYVFKEYIKRDKLIRASSNTSIVSSSLINRYLSQNFIDVPQLKISSNQNTTTRYGIINFMGSDSVNSFSNSLRVVPGDILKLVGTSSNDSRDLLVSSIEEKTDGTEIIYLDTETISEELFNKPILIEVFSNQPIVTGTDVGDDELYDIFRSQEDGPGVTPGGGTAGITSAGTTCNCPPDEPRPPVGAPGSDERKKYQEWLAEQMKCCQCLLYAEASCNADCMECVAWVLHNRQRDVNNAITRDEGTPCRQAESREFSGRCSNNNKFKSCFCNKKIGNAPDPGLPAERDCLNQASSLCKRIGLGNWKNLPDPTGGANYFMRCGGEPGWMACNIAGGRCKKLEAGLTGPSGEALANCSNCPTCFYKCDKTPKPCDWFKRKGIIQSDGQGGWEATSLYKRFIEETADEASESVNYLSGEVVSPNEYTVGPYAISGYYPLYTTPEAAVEASPSPKKIRRGEKTRGYHVHTIAGVEYYMPNGLVMGVSQFHGDYWEMNPNGSIAPSTPASTTSTPASTTSTPASTTSTPSTPSPPSTPPPAPPSGGGGGGGYGY